MAHRAYPCFSEQQVRAIVHGDCDLDLVMKLTILMTFGIAAYLKLSKASFSFIS
ncbi:MAG: hypothetical protein ACJ71U_09750 [Terriglobales bacterium]